MNWYRRHVCTAIAALVLAAGNAAAGEDPTRRVAVSVLQQRAPLPIVLATCAHDTQRNRLLIFGGRIQDKPEVVTLLSMDLQTEHWEKLAVEGPAPRGTSGPSLVYVDGEDTLYLFGGWPLRADAPLAELWTLELAVAGKLRWKLLSDGHDGPPPRNGCCMVADPKRKRLILHGGDGGPHPEHGFTPLDDLWEFDLISKKWRQLNPSGEVPQPRWNHSAAIDRSNDVLFVFGGAGYVGPALVLDRNVSSLDLKTLKWSRLPARGTPPLPIEGTTLTHDREGNLLVVTGGMPLTQWGKAGSRSVWCFDLATQTWTEHRELLPSTRQDHLAIYDAAKRRHIVLGGETVTGGGFYDRGTALTDVLSITVTENGED